MANLFENEQSKPKYVYHGTQVEKLEEDNGMTLGQENAAQLQDKYKRELEQLRSGLAYASDFGNVTTYHDADKAHVDRAYTRIIGMLGLYRSGRYSLEKLLETLTQAAQDGPASVQSIYQSAAEEARELEE